LKLISKVFEADNALIGLFNVDNIFILDVSGWMATWASSGCVRSA
jgi:hypothetical protein